MTVGDFTRELARALTDRGVTRDEAASHISTLAGTLTEDDLREITEYNTPEDFTELSDSLAEIIIKKRRRRSVCDPHTGGSGSAAAPSNAKAMPNEADRGNANATQTRSFDTVRTDTAPARGAVADPNELDMTRTAIGSAVPFGDDSPDGGETAQEIYLEQGEVIREKVVLTSRGRGFFITFSIITSPLWIAFFALVLAVFGMSLAAVCLLIAVALVLVCAEAAGGGFIALVGIIYGASQLFGGYIGTGIFECGIGVAVGGISMALGILTYNFAVVTLPYVLRHLVSFEGYALRHTCIALDRMREECNKL